MEQSDTHGKSKWYGRISMLFAILFAIFWSLGPFFFWVLSGLTASFGFLSLYYSGVKLSLFNRPPQAKPYQNHRSAGTGGQASPPVTETASPTDPVIVLPKTIRVFIIAFAAMLAFFFIVGVFLGNDDDPASSSDSVAVTSEPIKAEDAESLTNKGNEFFSQTQYDSALKYYDRVLAIDPVNQAGLYNKALVFFMKQDYRRSISLARKCLQLNSDYNIGWWLMGDGYFSMNKIDSAVICLEIAYNNNYTDPNFLQLMGDVYLKKGDRTRAKEFYIKVIDQDTTKAEVYRQLAELDPENANEYIKKANELEQNAK